jgi:hypothetical protein
MTICSSKQLRISPDRIHYLKFILEGYDNLATLSTVDARQGLVRIRYTPEVEEDLTQLLTEIASDIVK